MAFFAASTWVAVGLGGAAAYSSYANGQANNASAQAGQENAWRRYAIQSENADAQGQEQHQLALEKMTEVTRMFLANRGKMEVAQAETMVGGNVAKRLAKQNATDASEEKGQIAKTANANIVNIAQNLLGDKVDTEAQVMEFQSRKKSSMQLLLDAGVSGVSTFASFGGMDAFAESGIKKGNTGSKNG